MLGIANCRLSLYCAMQANAEVRFMASGSFLPLKILSYVVLFLMIVATVYAFGISLVHWSGIGV